MDRLLVIVAVVTSCSAFAAGLVVPPGGISPGEVQPGEAIEKTVVIGNDGERVIAVSRVKACGRNEK